MNVNLVPWTNQVLYRPTAPFDFVSGSVDPRELVQNLSDTMMSKLGIGLAGPQIGVPLSVFVMWGSPPIAIFNPRIVDASTKNQVSLEEGCLSYPGLVLKIKRPAKIRARFQTVSGDTVTKVFEGLTARTFLHEMDHTLGVNFFTLVSRAKLDVAIRKANKAGIVPAYSIGALNLAAKGI